MNCLVTGGTGFIGGALVHRLVKEGHKVRVLDNDLRGTKERLHDVFTEIELVQADIRDREAVENACKGIDCVWHLAFLNGTEFFYSKPDLVLDIGVKGMVNIIDGCIKAGVKKLILASSSEVYQTPPVVPTDEYAPLSIPDPLNPRYSYAAGKIISEIMAINYGRKYFEKVIIFRPHNVYGPAMGWEHVIPQFALRMRKLCQESSEAKIKFPIQGTGKETRAFVFIEDFIDGLILLMDKGEHLGIYHIGTMEELTIEDVAIEIGKYFGRGVTVVAGELAKGGTLRRCPDISKIKKLGYQPGYKFSDGLPVTVKWYDENSNLFGRKNI
ncbi:MAG: nucleoside-diphosphate-sugar epimerase [Candidatus Saganbacteria bacterium]|uniref:Nucleoside-diphosphate-sugar epimerase n=1 Tax=Candidatus Saganbacteria bacterium TaxID=2575572 RepID=A0A833NSP1_UNCSA|nr:MAG: nucleoside-diphosphate-sugar epimerase [Candidatus Saganbacteria bacterium]